MNLYFWMNQLSDWVQWLTYKESHLLPPTGITTWIQTEKCQFCWTVTLDWRASNNCFIILNECLHHSLGGHLCSILICPFPRTLNKQWKCFYKVFILSSSINELFFFYWPRGTILSITGSWHWRICVNFKCVYGEQESH